VSHAILLDKTFQIKYFNMGIAINELEIGTDMKKSLIIFGLLFAAFLIAGCATRQQVARVQMQLDEIRADQQAIRAENARLDSLFRSNIEQSKKLNADMADYVDGLDQRMQMVEARLTDAVTLLNRASAALESRGGRVPVTPGDTAKSDTSNIDAGIDCRKIYNAAYSDMVKERYDMAINGYRNYIENCSNTALADNAQYFIGESYFSMKQYEKAQKAFETMIEQYPSSEKMAAAKLKLGRALYEQRMKTKARSYFEDVAKNYIGTDEAQEASKMLERYR
jgi:tol-pal system protein YbgF